MRFLLVCQTVPKLAATFHLLVPQRTHPQTDNTMKSPRSLKRQRTESLERVLTPPAQTYDPMSAALLERATHVLSTEATALSDATRLYETDPVARDGLLNAVHCICKAQASGGRVFVCGVGKSGYIGLKLAATFKSLGIAASFMHAGEAAHGDLGDIRAVRALIYTHAASAR